jgi:hypothetical protein
MKIKKAIKRQNRTYKWFYIIMSLIFLLFPLAVFITDTTTPFVLSYLVFIEIFIIFSLLLISNKFKIKYSCRNNKLRIKCGWFGEDNIIFCDRVALVHTENKNDDMQIIIITSIKGRFFKPITENFFAKHTLAAAEYKKIKILYPDNVYYYTIVKYGGLQKYLLLDIIYKNCVKAKYTSTAIENIKIAREQIEI